MFVNHRDHLILLALALYGFLTRRQVQHLLFQHADDRIVRRCLARLVEKGLIRQHPALGASVRGGGLALFYVLTAAGREYLAEETGDEAFLYKPIELPHALVHAMAVVEFHIMFDAAIAAQTDVVLEAWHNEGDVINADDPDPAKHYRLHTKLSYKPKGSCSPDAAFLLNRGGRRAAYYLELERGTAAAAPARGSWRSGSAPDTWRWPIGTFTRTIFRPPGSTGSTCCWSPPPASGEMLFVEPFSRRTQQCSAPTFGGLRPIQILRQIPC